MIRSVLVLAAGAASLLWFPWPLTLLIALGAALVEPLAPLFFGLLADALYYAPLPSGSPLPLYSFLGLALVPLLYGVRARLLASIMR